MSVHILPDPTPMSPAHQRLRDALRRLDQAERAGLTHPRLRVGQPELTHQLNGGHQVPTHRFSTRTEAVIVKIARKKARHDVWRQRFETATAFAPIWIAAGIIGLALLWVTSLLVTTFPPR